MASHVPLQQAFFESFDDSYTGDIWSLQHRIEVAERELQQGNQVVRQDAPPGALRRVVDFDPETLLGGRLAEESDPTNVALDNRGAGVAVYELQGGRADIVEQFEFPIELRCPDPVVLSGNLVIRVTVGPTTPEQVRRLRDLGTSAALNPPTTTQTGEDLPLPTYVGEIYEHVFEFDNFACGGAPAISAVLNAASFAGGTIAPNLIVSLFGQNLAGSAVIASATPLPTTLGGSIITLTDSAGVDWPLPLFFISAGQANGLIPGGVASGIARLSVAPGQGEAASIALRVADTDQSVGFGTTVTEVAPGLFSANANGQGVAAAVALTIAADGTRTSELIFSSGAAGSRMAIPQDVGGPGEQVVLLLFGSGFRDACDVQVRINGQQQQVLGVAASTEFAGLDQANVLLDKALRGAGDVGIELIADGSPANLVTMAIQ